ncbi:hypothetical protein CVT25_013480, partial [Psilocybe cyanescens]
KSPAVAKSAHTLSETTSSKIASSNTDCDPWHTVTQAGAGLIQAYNAIHTQTIVSPGDHSQQHCQFQEIYLLVVFSHTFTIRNTSKTSKQYKLSHAPAGTALTVQAVSIRPIFSAFGPVPVSSNAASIVITPSLFTFRPGQSQTVVASFRPPTGLDASTYPVYSGFIDIVSGSEKYHVSYLGLVGSLKNKQVVDNTDYFFGFPIPAILNAAGDIQGRATNYTFIDGDYPSLLLVFGTPTLRIDLVNPSISLVPTLGKRGPRCGSFFTFPHKNKGGSLACVKVVGPLASFDYITRQSEDVPSGTAWNLNVNTPTFANSTAVPKGAYHILLRTLRVTGNAAKQEDYESRLSPPSNTYMILIYIRRVYLEEIFCPANIYQESGYVSILGFKQMMSSRSSG